MHQHRGRQVAWPGIEPGFAGSQPDVITTILPRGGKVLEAGGKWRIRTPSLAASTVFKTA